MPENNEKILTDEILADARRQAKRKLETAKQSADQILSKGRSNADETKKNILDEAHRKLEHDRGLILADIPHQRQIQTLQIKEQIIAGLFDQALSKLKSRQGYDLGAALVELSAQAVAELGGDSFLLEVAPQDAKAFSERLLRDVPARVQQATGRKATFQVAESDKLPDGGVIIRSADGRMMVDNSFATRIRRARQALRTDIAKLLFGESAA